MLGPTPGVAESVDLGWGLRICVPKFPGMQILLIQEPLFEDCRSRAPSEGYPEICTHRTAPLAGLKSRLLFFFNATLKKNSFYKNVYPLKNIYFSLHWVFVVVPTFSSSKELFSRCSAPAPHRRTQALGLAGSVRSCGARA